MTLDEYYSGIVGFFFFFFFGIVKQSKTLSKMNGYC